MLAVSGMLCGCNQKAAGAQSGQGAIALKDSYSESELLDVTTAFWNIEADLNEAAALNDPLQKIMQEKTGVKIVAQNITWEDDAAKIKLWAASDSLPDMFAGDFVG